MKSKLIHQFNLEFLRHVICIDEDKAIVARYDRINKKLHIDIIENDKIKRTIAVEELPHFATTYTKITLFKYQKEGFGIIACHDSKPNDYVYLWHTIESAYQIIKIENNFPPNQHGWTLQTHDASCLNENTIVFSFRSQRNLTGQFWSVLKINDTHAEWITPLMAINKNLSLFSCKHEDEAEQLSNDSESYWREDFSGLTYKDNTIQFYLPEKSTVLVTDIKGNKKSTTPITTTHSRALTWYSSSGEYLISIGIHAKKLTKDLCIIETDKYTHETLLLTPKENLGKKNKLANINNIDIYSDIMWISSTSSLTKCKLIK